MPKPLPPAPKAPLRSVTIENAAIPSEYHGRTKQRGPDGEVAVRAAHLVRCHTRSQRRCPPLALLSATKVYVPEPTVKAARSSET